MPSQCILNSPIKDQNIPILTNAIELVNLPVDILVCIFKWLNIGDIFNLILTCKTLKNLLINENSIWRSVYQGKLIICDGENKYNSTRSCYNRCRISHNWYKGIYKSKSIINHQITYMPWMQYQSEGLLLTVGSELICYPVDKNGIPNCNKINWKLTMPRVDRNDIRTDDISRFILKDNLLICGNRNGSVALYKVNNIKSKPHLVRFIKDCHVNGAVEVSAVEIVNNRENSYMVSASNDCVKIMSWDTESEVPDLVRGATGVEGCRPCMTINIEDCSGAKCLAINKTGEKLAIGPDGNSKPILFDVNTADLLISSQESQNVHQAVRDIQWHDNNTLCYVTHSGVLEMIDIRSNTLIYNVRDQFQSSFYCLKSDGANAIITGTSQYSRCVLYDCREPRHVQIFFTQKKSSPVYSLDFDSTKLIAAVDRGVAVLNFNVSTSTYARDYSDIFQ